MSLGIGISISPPERMGEQPQKAIVRHSPERKAARWFFGAAALISIAEFVIAPHLRHGSPNLLIFVALLLALAGLTADLAVSAIGADSSQFRQLESGMEADRWCAFAVAVMFLAFYGATVSPPTPYNEHVRLAWSLLHGHAWINAPAYMEHVVVAGHSYILHPPLPGILMLPAVALWGMKANQTSMAVVLGAGSLAIAWRLLGRIGLDLGAKIWLVVFFGIGTTFWYESTLGSSWDFALLASVPFTLGALVEIFGEARPLIVGILAGLAALARYDLVLAWPIYLLMLGARRRSWREMSWILPGFAAAGLIYVAYNEIRFGTPNDIALWLWYAQDNYRLARPGGPFALRDLPFNLYTLLFMAPGYSDKFPWIRPEFMGQAIVLISPAFLLALRPSFSKPLPALVLAAAAISSGPSLLVYANGFAQLGSRYYVQVYPFLIALIALGAPRKLDQLTKILIVLSIALVIFFTWQVRWYGWGG